MSFDVRTREKSPCSSVRGESPSASENRTQRDAVVPLDTGRVRARAGGERTCRLGLVCACSGKPPHATPFVGRTATQRSPGEDGSWGGRAGWGWEDGGSCAWFSFWFFPVSPTQRSLLESALQCATQIWCCSPNRKAHHEQDFQGYKSEQDWRGGRCKASLGTASCACGGNARTVCHVGCRQQIPSGVPVLWKADLSALPQEEETD